MAVTIVLNNGEEFSTHTIRDAVSVDLDKANGRDEIVCKDADGTIVGRFHHNVVVGWYIEKDARAGGASADAPPTFHTTPVPIRKADD
jgi:hypothetical protein